jgi:hypothetical protein
VPRGPGRYDEHMRFHRPLAVALVAATLAAAPVARSQDRGGGLGGGFAVGNAGDEKSKLPNDPKEPLHVRVNQAIDSGVAWLLGKAPGEPKVFISAVGNWSDTVDSDTLYDPNAKGDHYVHPTGCTSLALYALLKSGVPKDDPVVKKGFQWLRTGNASMTKGKSGKGKTIGNRIPGGSYEIATLILALEAKANPHKLEADRERQQKFRLKKGEKLKMDVKLDPEDESWMKELLVELKKRQVGGAGWRYGQFTGAGYHNGVRGDKDLSATNLAMLAFAAGERCGISQSDEFYANVLRWTMTMQEKDGPDVTRWDPTLKDDDRKYGQGKDKARGFGYLGTSGVDKENVASGSMTCCGLANIVICTTILEARESKAYTGDLLAAAEKSWWDGLAWLDYNWSVDHNVNSSQGYHYYYLYCLERACDMKRIKLVAGRPWYNLGAEVLVNDQINQGSNGAWTKQDTHRPSDVLNTCFALLFLNRATPAITSD